MLPFVSFFIIVLYLYFYLQTNVPIFVQTINVKMLTPDYYFMYMLISAQVWKSDYYFMYMVISAQVWKSDYYFMYMFILHKYESPIIISCIC